MELINVYNKKVDQKDDSNGFLKEILSLRVKASDDIKGNEYIIKIAGINKFSKGDISGWIGKAKSKKTFALTLFASSFLGGFKTGKFTANKKGKLLWIDTEQSPKDVQSIAKRVRYLVGSDKDLYIYGLRPKSPKERIKAIETLLTHYKDIELLIIDGVRDLLMDINNPVECTEVMTLLMKWSCELNIHVATVLHQNKGDGLARGHIGTELENKAQSTIRVTKDSIDNNTSWIEELSGRGKGFEKFSFSIDNNGIPHFVEQVIDLDDEEEPPY